MILALALDAPAQPPVGCITPPFNSQFNWCWDHTDFGLQDFIFFIRLYAVTYTWSYPAKTPKMWSEAYIHQLASAKRLCQNANTCIAKAAKWVKRTPAIYLGTSRSTWYHTAYMYGDMKETYWQIIVVSK